MVKSAFLEPDERSTEWQWESYLYRIPFNRPAMESRRNVFESYDIIADWYASNRNNDNLEKPYLDKLIEITGEAATALDLGCGTGEPVMAYLLSQGLTVTGVDASHNILSIARENLSQAELIRADMRDLSLGTKFNAIIAWNSFFHLSQEEQVLMFPVFTKHLHHGGVLLFTSGSEAGEAWGMNGGENLYHASLDAEQYREQLLSNGFTVLLHVTNDPDCGGATVWMAQLT